MKLGVDPVIGAPHERVWPAGVPHTLTVPNESLCAGLEARYAQTPEAVGLDFLGTQFTWRTLYTQAQHLAGALQQQGLARGERVLLFMQNCPQFIIAFHAVLWCGGIVVPVNPMSKADELEHYLRDTQARIAISSLDIAGELVQAHQTLGDESSLADLIGFQLADALPANGAVVTTWPATWRTWLLTRYPTPTAAGLTVHPWVDVMVQAVKPHVVDVKGSDLALLPYTSGTTGQPKGCMHTHATLMHNVLASAPWLDMQRGDSTLIVVPMFHITGLVVGMLSSIRHGCSMVLLPRWDRAVAGRAIGAHRITHWPNIPTMLMDLLGGTDLVSYDLSSLRYIGGGGAAMPDAVATQLQKAFGLEYLEGYGLTETSAPTHTNPRGGARQACLGIPYIGTEAHIINPDTLQPLTAGEVGEIVVRGPQVFIGYWNLPDASSSAFMRLDGKEFFRTGDLGRMDTDGYFYMADRLKRMINASGFKVWPAEVEGLLHRHPAVQEACVIATRDPYRGESVKALIVLKQGSKGALTTEELIAWAREHMSAYKYPRSIEFVDVLPRSASGKLMWRIAQAQQDLLDKTDSATS